MAIKLGDIFANGDINMNNQRLEEVINKTKIAAENFGKKSAEHIEISRKKLEILDLRTRLSKLYEGFGKMQYNKLVNNGGASSESEEDMIMQISLYEEKISLLSEEVERAKAQFNDAVANATKKTRDAFQKEFDKMNKNEVTVEPVNEE